MPDRLSDECYEILLSLSDPMVGREMDDIPTPKGTQPLLYLCSKGYIEATLWKPADESHPVGTHGYCLTPEGQEALSLETKRREREAKEESEKHREAELQDIRWRKDARRSWVQWTITTVIAFLSFFSGAVVEKFTGFVEWILRWFK